MTGFPFSPRIDFGNSIAAYGPHRPSEAAQGGPWIHSGSIVVTPSAYTCTDGVVMDHVTDTDPVDPSYVVIFHDPIKTEGRKYVSFRIKANSLEPMLVYFGENATGYNLAGVLIDPADMMHPQEFSGQVIAITPIGGGDSYEYLLRTKEAMMPGVVSHIVFQPARNNPTNSGIGHFIGNVAIWEDYHQAIPFSNSMGIWLPSRVVKGGYSESAAGIPESFVVRKDSMLSLNLRMTEDQWSVVHLWLDWCYDAGANGWFSFYPDGSSLTYPGYGHTPKVYLAYLVEPNINNHWEPTRLPQQNLYELKVKLRLRDAGQTFNILMNAQQLD